MKILYVMPSLQHPSIRGALRHYHLLRGLAARHDVTLLVLSSNGASRHVRDEIGAITRETRFFSSDSPSSSDARRGLVERARASRRRALRSRAARAALGSAYRSLEASGSFDVVLFHGKCIAGLLGHGQRTPVAIDFCDAASIRLRERIRYSPPIERPWRIAKLIEMRGIERRLVHLTSDLAFITPRDRAAVLGPESRAPVIPNGIDLSYWTAEGAEREPSTLLFTGVMDYAPNTDAAVHLIEEVMPRLRERRPGVTLLVVGRNPPSRLLDAARPAPDVTVTGAVEDLRPYLASAAAYVAPIRYASGLQNKILEALAMEVPVVTTSVVASGVEMRPGEKPPVGVADDPDTFAEAVLGLLGSDEARGRAARLGRSYVEEHFDWERSAELLEALCTRAAERRSNATTTAAARRWMSALVPSSTPDRG